MSPVRTARSAARQAEGDSPSGTCVLVWREGNRGGGKVGNLLLVFHFSIRPRRRSCGNVGISPALGEISKGLVERVGSLPFGFPRFPQRRHFHSSLAVFLGSAQAPGSASRPLARISALSLAPSTS